MLVVSGQVSRLINYERHHKVSATTSAHNARLLITNRLVPGQKVVVGTRPVSNRQSRAPITNCVTKWGSAVVADYNGLQNKLLTGGFPVTVTNTHTRTETSIRQIYCQCDLLCVYNPILVRQGRPQTSHTQKPRHACLPST